MAGRPSKYRTEFAELAKNYCLLGATDPDLARFFGVSRSVISEWKKVYPKFAAALQSKEAADAQVVGALFKNALAGNVTAQIFWLKNRQKDNWRDKVDHELSGKDGGPISHNHTIEFVKP